MKIQVTDLTTAVFTKSTYSNGGDNCIEVAAVPGTTAFRDSKDLRLGAVAVSTTAFDHFVSAVKTKALD